MKKPIPNKPTFDPANRTLDFSSTPNFDITRLYGVINIRTGQLIYSPLRPSLAPANIAGALITLSVNTNGMRPADPLFIQYNDGINDLSPDASTATRQDAQRVVLEAIRDAIKAQHVETIWTDDTGKRFLRIDNAGAISWTDVAGNPSAPPGAGARPDSDSSTVVSQSTYRATADGPGFSAQDYLNHVVVTDGDAGDLLSSFWLNVTAGAKIAAPSVASITPLAPLPDGAATAARQDTGNTSLASLLAGIGTPADPTPGTDAAASTVIGRLGRLLASTTGLATLQDTGNKGLAALLVGIGKPDDAAPGTDAAAGSVIARLARLLASTTGLATLLTSIRDRLSGTLEVHLDPGTEVIGRVGLQVGGSDLAPDHPLPTQERAAQGAVALGVGAAAVAPGRLFAVICTAAGTVVVTFADGSTLAVPVTPGFQAFPFAVTKVLAAGTTATATYANLS